LKLKESIRLLRYTDIIKKDATFQRFLRNSSFQFSANIVITGLSFAQTIILGRYLGPDKYGLLALIVTYINLVSQFFSFSMWEIVIKYGSDFLVASKNKEFLAIVKFGYVADSLAGILAFCASILLARFAAVNFFHRTDMELLIYLFTFTIFMTFLDNTSNAVLRVHNKFAWIAVRDIIINILKFISLWIVLLLSLGLKGVILTMLTYCLLVSIINLIMTFKIMKTNPIKLIMYEKLSLLANYKQDMKKFIISNYLTNNWVMVLANIDTIILGYFRNITEVGYYRMSKNFVNLLARMIEPFNIVIYPDLSKLWASKSLAQFKNLLKKSTITVLILVMPIALFIILFITQILQITVGASFIPAVASTRLMVLGALIAALFFWTRPTILAMGKPHIPAWVNLISVFLVIGLSILIVPLYGFLGSAGIYIVPILFGNLSVAFFVHKTYRESTA
jgi:O-antigen/teichoic acid export membrane protein